MTSENVQYWKDAHALLLDENKKLKEELEQEKDGREHDVQQFQSVLEEKTELEDLVEELKTSLQTTTSYWTANYELLQEENKKLKEENNNLKVEGSIALEIRTEENECNKKNMFRFMDENTKLKEENKKLNDDDWVIDNHKALKYKCVLDEDYYLDHLDDQGELIDPDEFNDLQEENKKLVKKSLNMENYLEIHEVKYCEKDGCGRYVDEETDEIACDPVSCEWICKDCQDDK